MSQIASASSATTTTTTSTPTPPAAPSSGLPPGAGGVLPGSRGPELQKKLQAVRLSQRGYADVAKQATSYYAHMHKAVDAGIRLGKAMEHLSTFFPECEWSESFNKLGEHQRRVNALQLDFLSVLYADFVNSINKQAKLDEEVAKKKFDKMQRIASRFDTVVAKTASNAKKDPSPVRQERFDATLKFTIQRTDDLCEELDHHRDEQSALWLKIFRDNLMQAQYSFYQSLAHELSVLEKQWEGIGEFPISHDCGADWEDISPLIVYAETEKQKLAAIKEEKKLQAEKEKALKTPRSKKDPEGGDGHHHHHHGNNNRAEGDEGASAEGYSSEGAAGEKEPLSPRKRAIQSLKKIVPRKKAPSHKVDPPPREEQIEKLRRGTVVDGMARAPSDDFYVKNKRRSNSVSDVLSSRGYTTLHPSGTSIGLAPLRFKALYDYTGLSEAELSFQEGDIITIIGKPDDFWWDGELNGKVGYVPSNYLSTTEEHNLEDLTPIRPARPTSRPSRSKNYPVSVMQIALEAETPVPTPVEMNGDGGGHENGHQADGEKEKEKEKENEKEKEKEQEKGKEKERDAEQGEKTHEKGEEDHSPAAAEAPKVEAAVATSPAVAVVYFEYSSEDGTPYYFNSATEETVWVVPEGATVTKVD